MVSSESKDRLNLRFGTVERDVVLEVWAGPHSVYVDDIRMGTNSESWVTVTAAPGSRSGSSLK